MSAAMQPDYLPARMLNEFTYCPRLFYLEWVQGEWADSADTEEGRFRHRRVDREGGALPLGDDESADDQPDRIHARSVTLSSDRLGAIARLDLTEGEDVLVSPVDYKRGSIPDVQGQAWEPEKVQLCLQGLILRDNGFRCDEGFLYFAESRERICVPLDPPLVELTERLLTEARMAAGQDMPPPPLTDSPKCPRCSLVGICLPEKPACSRIPPHHRSRGG